MHRADDAGDVGVVVESSGAGSSDNAGSVACTVGYSGREDITKDAGDVVGEGNDSGITQSSSDLQIGDGNSRVPHEESIPRDKHISAIKRRDASNNAVGRARTSIPASGDGTAKSLLLSRVEHGGCEARDDQTEVKLHREKSK